MNYLEIILKGKNGDEFGGVKSVSLIPISSEGLVHIPYRALVHCWCGWVRIYPCALCALVCALVCGLQTSGK